MTSSPEGAGPGEGPALAAAAAAGSEWAQDFAPGTLGAMAAASAAEVHHPQAVALLPQGVPPTDGPAVPLPGEKLARACSSMDPSGPPAVAAAGPTGAQLAAPAAAPAAAVAAPAVEEASTAENAPAAAAAAGAPDGGCPDAATAAAEAEAALGAAGGSSAASPGLPAPDSAVAAAEAARRDALAAGWARAAFSGGLWQQQPQQGVLAPAQHPVAQHPGQVQLAMNPGIRVQQVHADGDAALAAAGAAAGLSVTAFPPQPQYHPTVTGGPQQPLLGQPLAHPFPQHHYQPQPVQSVLGPQPSAAAAAAAAVFGLLHQQQAAATAQQQQQQQGGQWHRVPVQEAALDADFVLAGLPYALEGERRHHLLKHELPDEARGMNALKYFGVDNVRQAVRRINKMAQRELQEMFQRVYGVRSSSNNNLWLRKKLIEAVNTRPRGGSGGGSGSERTSSRTLPASIPTSMTQQGQQQGGGPAGAAGDADPTMRRRRKKSSAPVRASDGLQADPENAADALLALLGGTGGGYSGADANGSSDYESESSDSRGRQAVAARAAGTPAKRAKVEVNGTVRARYFMCGSDVLTEQVDKVGCWLG